MYGHKSHLPDTGVFHLRMVTENSERLTTKDSESEHRGIIHKKSFNSQSFLTIEKCPFFSTQGYELARNAFIFEN